MAWIVTSDFYLTVGARIAYSPGNEDGNVVGMLLALILTVGARIAYSPGNEDGNVVGMFVGFDLKYIFYESRSSFSGYLRASKGFYEKGPAASPSSPSIRNLRSH